MIKHLKNSIALIVLFFINAAAFAQDTIRNTDTDAPLTVAPPVEMATGLYQSGKIYVVVGVVAIIFTGILVYLILLDRKVGKLEKEILNK